MATNAVKDLKVDHREEKIVKIQAHTRGFLQRKKLYEEYQVKYGSASGGPQHNDPNGAINRPSFNTDQVPNYSNQDVQQIRAELGDFDYGAEEFSHGRREMREQIQLDNGARYEGEWLMGEQVRAGKGVQIWPDGSMYEGWWLDNKANGKGRLIHADGDIYDGHWQDDKAHGFGVYSHLDGARYEGYWKEDK